MPLSPSQTRQLLEQLGHQPRQKLGQNFLVDGNIVRKSIEFAQLASGEEVVEVGPGLGTLTEALLGAGARVWAVEADLALFGHLERTLAPANPGRLHLMHADAVEHPIAGCPVGPDAPPYKVVANLPYAIATPWLDALLSGPLPARMVLMLQREAADRYCARSGTKQFGAISIFLQALYEVSDTHLVAASCFWPRPEVESRLLCLSLRQGAKPIPRRAREFIRELFQKRRKQVGALLRSSERPEASVWAKALAAEGIALESRAEAIPLETWVRIAGASSPA